MTQHDICNFFNEVFSNIERHGQQITTQYARLILVNTGKVTKLDGNVFCWLIDEFHTAESLRNLSKFNYKQQMKDGLEHENMDKFFYDFWFSA